MIAEHVWPLGLPPALSINSFLRMGSHRTIRSSFYIGRSKPRRLIPNRIRTVLGSNSPTLHFGTMASATSTCGHMFKPYFLSPDLCIIIQVRQQPPRRWSKIGRRDPYSWPQRCGRDGSTQLQAGKPVAVSLPVFEDSSTGLTNWTMPVGWDFGRVINPPPTSVAGRFGHCVCIVVFPPRRERGKGWLLHLSEQLGNVLGKVDQPAGIPWLSLARNRLWRDIRQVMLTRSPGNSYFSEIVRNPMHPLTITQRDEQPSPGDLHTRVSGEELQVPAEFARALRDLACERLSISSG